MWQVAEVTTALSSVTISHLFLGSCRARDCEQSYGCFVAGFNQEVDAEKTLANNQEGLRQPLVAVQIPGIGAGQAPLLWHKQLT